MKRAIPVLVLSIAGLIPLWRYAPSHDTGSSPAAAAPASTPSVSSSGGTTTTVPSTGWWYRAPRASPAARK